jgi:hypothetical protein
MVFVVMGCGGGGGSTATTDPPADPPADPIFRLKASDAKQGAAFGTAVTVDAGGGRIAVGAPLADGLTLGSGKSYIFDWNGTAWVESALIESENADVTDGLGSFEFFGRSVSLSGDGTILVVGAPWDCGDASSGCVIEKTGSVHVFNYDALSSSWQLATAATGLKMSSAENKDAFGKVVSISADGETLVGGAPRYDGLIADSDAGAIQVVGWSGTAWDLSLPKSQRLMASDFSSGDEFGQAVSINADGTLIAVGAPFEDGGAGDPAVDAGAVYVYRWNGATSTWDETAIYGTVASGEFGDAVVLAGDGSMLAIGATGEPGAATSDGKVYLYEWDAVATAWTPLLELAGINPDDGDLFGSSIAFSGAAASMMAVGAEGEDSQATGINGDSADDTVADSGAAYLGTESAGVVTSDYYKASNTGAGDRFGGAIALSSGADTLVVGARGEDGTAADDNDLFTVNSGAVYVY